MRIGDKLLLQYKSSRRTNYFTAYKMFRNRVVNEMNDSKNQYYNKHFNGNTNNIKIMWRGFRNIIKLKANVGSNITEIKTEDGCRLDDPVQIANNFNNVVISLM